MTAPDNNEGWAHPRAARWLAFFAALAAFAIVFELTIGWTDDGCWEDPQPEHCRQYLP
ncbi:MAG: hypothetical protein AAGA37_15835 [Actinomycetota bacterium]